jgi:hypothetical protein
MPTIDKLITEVSTHVIYPVSDQIVKALLGYLGIYHMFKDNNLYIEDTVTTAINTETEKHTSKINTNRCDVKVTPILNPSNTKWDTYTYQFHRLTDSSNRVIYGDTPIFYDKRADVYLHEVTVPCSVELDFLIRVRSKELAELVYNSIFAKFQGDSSIHAYNEIIYSYPISDILLLYLFKIYKLRELEDDPSFKEYLKYGSDDRFDLLVNRNDLDKSGTMELVINKSNNYVLGQMDFNQDSSDTNVDKKNKFVENFSIEFKYVFQFARPSLLRLHYPVLIDNNMVPATMLPKQVETQSKDLITGYKDVAISNYANNKDYGKFIDEFYKTVRYPGEDDWVIPYVKYQQLLDRFYPLFIGLLSVDVDTNTGDTSLSINMEDIFEIFDTRLKDHILHYLDMSILGNLDLFNISIFSNDLLINPNDITLNGTTFTITERIRSYKLYRIVVSISRNVSWISRDSVSYILDNNEDFLPLIMRDFNYLLQNKYIHIVESSMPYDKHVESYEHGKQYTLLGVKHGIGKAFRVGNYIVKSRR